MTSFVLYSIMMDKFSDVESALQLVTDEWALKAPN